MVYVLVYDAQHTVIHDRTLPRAQLLDFIDKQFALGFTVEVRPA